MSNFASDPGILKHQFCDSFDAQKIEWGSATLLIDSVLTRSE